MSRGVEFPPPALLQSLLRDRLDGRERSFPALLVSLNALVAFVTNRHQLPVTLPDKHLAGILKVVNSLSHSPANLTLWASFELFLPDAFPQVAPEILLVARKPEDKQGCLTQILR